MRTEFRSRASARRGSTKLLFAAALVALAVLVFGSAAAPAAQSGGRRVGLRWRGKVLLARVAGRQRLREQSLELRQVVRGQGRRRARRAGGEHGLRLLRQADRPGQSPAGVRRGEGRQAARRNQSAAERHLRTARGTDRNGRPADLRRAEIPPRCRPGPALLDRDQTAGPLRTAVRAAGPGRRQPRRNPRRPQPPGGERERRQRLHAEDPPAGPRVGLPAHLRTRPEHLRSGDQGNPRRARPRFPADLGAGGLRPGADVEAVPDPGRFRAAAGPLLRTRGSRGDGLLDGGRVPRCRARRTRMRFRT